MTEISTKTARLLALSMLKGVGPSSLKKVSQIPFFEEADIADLLPNLPRNAGANIPSASIQKAIADADRQIELAVASGSQIISAADSEYPNLLKDTKDDPQILFVKGRLAEDIEKSVAIIGTREPTAHGEVITGRLTAYFVEAGWSIVSGLALGCDALAHQAALDAGGHTVAVLAHGLHTMAPKRHQKLAEAILEAGGAWVTEYRFGQDPMPAQFVKRDRIQAGLAQGVVMVQSDLKGGSLHASRASLEYGRWLAVPYPTNKDIAAAEPKIQANILFAEGSPSDKAKLLKCQPAELERLIILRSKSDYAKMLGNPREVSPQFVEETSPQQDLFSASAAEPKPDGYDPKLLSSIRRLKADLMSSRTSIAENGHAVSENESYRKLLDDLDKLSQSLDTFLQPEDTNNN